MTLTNENGRVGEASGLSQVEPASIKLTKSEEYAIRAQRTWSGAQRNRLIDKGLVAEGCRRGPPLPKRAYEASSYALLLTPLGHAVRRSLTHDSAAIAQPPQVHP